jgi:hypothetical protein
MFAMNVKVFLEETKVSLFYVEYVSEFTIAMFAIWTEAQPMLNIAGSAK